MANSHKFQARSVFRHSKIRENVAERADTVGIAPAGTDYGILIAFVCLFFVVIFYTLLSQK